MNLHKEKANFVKCPMIKESPVSVECKVKEIKELGSHTMFIADVLAINSDEKYIDEITYEMLIDFMIMMKLKYKPKTASNGVMLVGSIMKYAFFEGYIKYNPYFGVINSKCK